MATLIDIIDRPKQTFQQAKDQPRKWIWPAVLIAVSMLILAIVVSTAETALFSSIRSQFGTQGFPNSGQGITQGAAPSGQRSGAASGQTGTTTRGSQAAQGSFPTRTGTAASGLTSSLPLTLGLKLGFLILAWIILAGLGYLFVKLFRGSGTLGNFFSVGVLASIPFFFRNLTQLVYYYATKSIITTQGLAFLVRTGRNSAAGALIFSNLLANIDLFSLWFFALLGIGLGTVGQLKWWKAVIITIILLAVVMAIRLIPILLNIGISAPILG
ncbi:MAG: YIP1 family protein [Anaerolineae bacterium]